MFALFKKETKQKEGIPQTKRLAIYCLIVIVVMLAGSMLQSVLILSLGMDNLNADSVILYNLYLTVITSLMILYIGIRIHGRTPESMGLTNRHVFRTYLLGHMIGFSTLSGALLMTYCLGGAQLVGVELHKMGLLVLYFIGFMLQGFEEELLCRGFMMYGLSKSKSVFYSMMANSLFFAVLHLGNPGIDILPFVNLFLAGLAFSCIAVYFDDIWVASGAHSMWNFAQGNFYGIPVSGMSMGPTVFQFELKGNDMLSGGGFGLEGGVGVFLIEIITILAVCFIYKIKVKDKDENS